MKNLQENTGLKQIITVRGLSHVERADKYLVSQLKGWSRQAIKNAIIKGEILVNQKKIKPSSHLKMGI